MENIEPKPKRLFSFKIFDRKRDSRILKWIFIGLIACASFIIVKDEVFWQLDSVIYGDDWYGEESGAAGEDCNVRGIELRGTLATYAAWLENEDGTSADITSSEDIYFDIIGAEENDEVKAIILEVDSYGGYPVAAEEVARALKKAKKPTVALIREGGVSAAYIAASGADIIFASENSDVGSIGVTMSYLDNSGKNRLEGLEYISLSSGRFKDAGDPNKELTREEQELLMRDVDIMHENIVKLVAENRNLEIDKVAELADGSSMLGRMALENGLIDRIGALPEVLGYLEELIGAKPRICW